jgi:DNA-binding winged helix-turn-helix (wHTH) protein/Tol biopolymer transport system component
MVRFGDFEVDLHSGELRKSGILLKLQEQPFKILQILLEHHGDLVTREELRSRIWPDRSFGDFDHAVNIAIGKLRAALGDAADTPSFVQTVPRRGYRFVAKVEDAPAEASGDAPVLAYPAAAPPIAAPPKGASSTLRLALMAALVLAVAGTLLGFGIFWGRRGSALPSPEFQRLTEKRGTVYSARFVPGGNGVMYAASWGTAPTEIFSADLKVPGARNLGLSPADLLAVSSSGELAVLKSLEPRFLLTVRGTLGRVPLAGGSPRPIAEAVEWADWAPDGTTLAVVRSVAGKQRLELPLGHVLYETAGWISHPRVSPKGGEVAFLDHPAYPDDRGTVCVVDLAGHERVLSPGWESEEGLAWSPDGKEIWFSAARAGLDRQIYAVDRAGHQRLIYRAPGGVTLHDIAADGSVLLTRDEQRVGMMALAPGAARERELSWRDWSLAMDLTPDGNTVLFDEQGLEGGSTYTVAMRDMQGASPPIPLGEGMAGGFSPDGKWATTIVSNNRLLLLPTGAGTARQLAPSGIQGYSHGAFWLPGGGGIIFTGHRAGHGAQCFIQNMNDGNARPVVPEGVIHCQVSPDGKWIAGTALRGDDAWLYPADGGAPRRIAGLLPGESVAWTTDPNFLYVYEGKQAPVRVDRLNVSSGERQFVRELSPPDLTGLHNISHVHFSADGNAYVYSYTRLLSELYLVKGLK